MSFEFAFSLRRHRQKTFIESCLMTDRGPALLAMFACLFVGGKLEGEIDHHLPTAADVCPYFNQRNFRIAR
jgi:hypothetical protein